jgi:hypothetical protein
MNLKKSAGLFDGYGGGFESIGRENGPRFHRSSGIRMDGPGSFRRQSRVIRDIEQKQKILFAVDVDVS